MTVVVVKIVTLNKGGVICNKITRVAAMLPGCKKQNSLDLLGKWKED